MFLAIARLYFAPSKAAQSALLLICYYIGFIVDSRNSNSLRIIQLNAFSGVRALLHVKTRLNQTLIYEFQVLNDQTVSDAEFFFPYTTEHFFRPEDLQIKNPKVDLLLEYTVHVSDSDRCGCELDAGKEKLEMTG